MLRSAQKLMITASNVHAASGGTRSCNRVRRSFFRATIMRFKVDRTGKDSTVSGLYPIALRRSPSISVANALSVPHPGQ